MSSVPFNIFFSLSVIIPIFCSNRSNSYELHFFRITDKYFIDKADYWKIDNFQKGESQKKLFSFIKRLLVMENLLL